MLKLHFKDNRYPPLWVVERTYSIGSAAENQLVLSEIGVDSLHAKLIKEDGKSYLKDNNSIGGCFVNGQRITQKEILPGDILRIGPIEIIVLDPRSQGEKPKDIFAAPWRLVADGNWLAGKQFVISGEKDWILGRGKECDIVIPGTHLSRRHAEISIEGNHLRIKDLASANGTYLNELRIDNTTANNGDRLRVDVYTFRVVAPDTEENKTRLRKPIGELAKPVELKVVSQEPKRWKTRPTSPGNRIEQPSFTPRKNYGWLLGLAALITAGIIVTLLLW
jgi:pSer/pThr/pTyr-binding forkhead associated (FHA) protein